MCVLGNRTQSTLGPPDPASHRRMSRVPPASPESMSHCVNPLPHLLPTLPGFPVRLMGLEGKPGSGCGKSSSALPPGGAPWEGAPTAPRQSSWIWRFLLSETKAPADPARRKGEEGRAGSAFWKLLRKGEPMSCVLSLGGVAWGCVFTAGHLGPWRGISPVTLPTARMCPDTSPGSEVLKRFRWTLCHEPSTALSVALSPELSQTLFPEQELVLSTYPSSQ